MKKNGVVCIGRALIYLVMILALLSLSFTAAFAEDGAAVANECGESHTDMKSGEGYRIFLGFNSANMTFGAYEDEAFFSVLLASNAKLYETILYGDVPVTAEVERPVSGKAYKLGYADVLGNMVYFSGEVDANGALVATDDAALAADVVVLPEGDGYILGVSLNGGVGYLGLARDAEGKYAFFLGDTDEIAERDAIELTDSELRSSFAYDGEVLEVEFTRFTPDNVCDDCGADLPGLSDGEIIAIVSVAVAVAIISVIVIAVYLVIRRKSAGYIFDANGFR